MQVAVAKVFTNDNGQSVLLPKQFQLDTNEVFISKNGNRLILTPRRDSWDGFVEGFSGLSDDFSTTEGLVIDTPRMAFE